MARIPPLRRLLAEDFPSEVQKWISPLLVQINNYFEQNTSALNKGLTISDNFAGVVKTVDIDGTFPVRIAWDLPSAPKTVLVGDVRTVSGASVTLHRTPGVQWSYNQAGELQIDAVFGVLPDPVTFTDSAVSTGADTITIPRHAFETADKVVLSTTGTLPTGLSAQTYHIIKDGTHTVRLAANPTDARAGNDIDITAASGGGTHIITPQYNTRYRLTIECKTG